VYRYADGGELFFESVLLWPSSRVSRVAEPPGPGVFWHVGEIHGDALAVDERGAVFRLEKGTGEWLEEGRRFDRWLLGVVEAELLLYDSDGEFRDDGFDDDSGEIAAPMRERMERRVLKRDRGAPAPRWRLARALVEQGKVAEGRAELEEVVAAAPGFAWAWYELAQISESLGEPEAAMDELLAAAEARPGYEHAGFFWAQAARIAATTGAEAARAEHAGRALAADPDLIRAQRDGAEATLEAGDPEAALRLIETALALAPRDLAALELRARIRDHLP
jgi:tetratricopeptide (TPR) repeat protein